MLVGTGTGCPQPQLGMQQLVPRQRALPKGSPSLPSSLPSCGNVTSWAFGVLLSRDLDSFLSSKEGICSAGGVEGLNWRVK